MKYLLLILLLILLASCNSVKRVIKDPQKLEEVGNYLAKTGFCINDTVTISKDSVIYITKDSIIRDTITAGNCPDFTKTLPSGIKVSSKKGLISVELPITSKEKQTVRTITQSIRDKKLEDILRKERDQALDKYVKEQSAKELAQNEVKVLQKEVSSQKRKFWLLLIGTGIGVLALIFFKVKKYIPFI